MKNSSELLQEISQVKAVDLESGFRIEAVLISGEIVVLKAKSNKKPAMVQLYDGTVNYSCSGEGGFFTYSKAAPKENFWGDKHLKGYAVA